MIEIPLSMKDSSNEGINLETCFSLSYLKPTSFIIGKIGNFIFGWKSRSLDYYQCRHKQKS